jgi:YD repeat-containing protein
MKAVLHLLAFGLSILFIAGACKKTAGTDPIAVRKCLINSTDYAITTGTFGSVTVSTAYMYNASRQLSKITETTITPGLGTQVDSQTLTYFADRIEAKPTALSIGSGIVSEMYALNGAVYISKITVQQLITGSTTPSTSTTNYEYNADGYLSKSTDNSNGSYRVYEYTNGNLTTVKGYAQNGNADYTTTLTYYTDKAPLAAIQPGIDANNNLLVGFYTAGLLGRTNKNALKQIVSGVNGEGTTDYTYTYDGDGNISSATAKSTIATKTGTNLQTRMTSTNYTYNCQ